MIFKTIAHLSDAYNEMLELRVRVLLSPIGIPASYIIPEKEARDFLLGAYDNDKLVGCCILTDRGNAQVQLRQMAVDTSVQGTGVGAELIRYAEKVAKENGFRTLFMHARNPVIGFYEKCGYKIVGAEFFEVDLGHHRMEKEIGA
ncbi:N-acetylglutamate synthase, GNAT family [Cnuella takakiae]|uniref:Probable N-acetyltransferase 14 n=1 Tax=Cnuella takakiae TaxID=1302690 RepID=A0A1M5HIX8_9BACT|nr:GNAT family N-acetyltransferase [Cnuella takakiae]OLY92887.1 hypothetical protein BUE76_14060 [Cnuella takakiae]SHG15895.1 N-acetylglutamate synthase, GNAT family [Cnuella takakiae]